ncbi:MAG: DUF452 family protein [[Clostridium] fimetarium]|nr:DUF452 family protein [Alistipes timonensis]MCM1405253.1 DUF452 family protein [[Clostridium] fimetarium]
MEPLDMTACKAEIAASYRFAGTPGESRLVMVFLGWGMSPEPFLQLSKPGYDVMLLWGYRRGEGFDGELRRIARGYKEIVVIAWSFGVVAASYLLEAMGDLPVTRKVAVNGTPLHIDRRRGIPPAVFNLTLRGLSEAAVEKFTARMFANNSELDAFVAAGNSRDFNSVADELHFFGDLPPYTGDTRWDFAVAGDRDLIFPPVSQEACWREAGVPLSVIAEAGHFIDLRRVLDDFVVDKELVATRFSAARNTYRDSAPAQRSVAARLWELARPHIPSGALRVLEVGVGDGLLTDLYVPELEIADLGLMDIAGVDRGRFPAGARFTRCDAEEAVAGLPEESVDLILSASTLQWFHSPERFVAMAYRALAPGGVMALSFFGEGTYREVADITGVSLKYPDPSRWKPEGVVLASLRETLTERFTDAAAAARHISRTGVNALRRDRASAVAAGRKLMRCLPAEADGRVGLTYVSNYLIIRKPI